ncbi:MAG: type I pullulanase [Lachnospirales bacterium]
MKSEGDYCYLISSVRIVILTIDEIVHDSDIIVKKSSMKEQIRGVVFNKKEVFFSNKKYFKYEIDFSEFFDITQRYYIFYDDSVQYIDMAQYYKTKEFNDLYEYSAMDLGVSYNSKFTSFKIWSPLATEVVVKVYDNEKTFEHKRYKMKKMDKGAWRIEVENNFKNKFYCYDITIHGVVKEFVDLHAKSISFNGKRGVIFNGADTDPKGFREHKFNRVSTLAEVIACETHIRDFTINPTSGVKQRGTYRGFTEKGSRNSKGLTTGLDHLIELGVNYVQLMPVFDFSSKYGGDIQKIGYNWGYEPENYNSPDASYSTNPYDSTLKIKELKHMIMNLHENGIGVLLDLSFDHTYTTKTSNFQISMPNYYYRTDNFGNITNGSSHGNELATERYMVRKFVIESIVYWAREFKVDGFRFSQMGLMDIETLNMIRLALDKIDTKIIMYGEGWAEKATPLQLQNQGIKENVRYLSNRIAVCSDDVKQGIRQDVFNEKNINTIESKHKSIDVVKFALVGSIPHVDSSKVLSSENYDFWAKSPLQVMNYISIHNDSTIWDKISKNNNNIEKSDMIYINKMVAFLLFITQGGIIFLLGEEFARTKKGDGNSYKSSDIINSIDWNRKSEFYDLFEYFKGLIQIRKGDEVFRLETSIDVKRYVSIEAVDDEFIVVTFISRGDVYEKYIALINFSKNNKHWNVNKNEVYVCLANKERCGTTPFKEIRRIINVKEREAVLVALPKKKKRR